MQGMEKGKKKGRRGAPSTFLSGLRSLLEEENPDVVGWNNDGDAFLVLNMEAFEKDVLPRRFKHSQFSSFQRQLNLYGFHKHGSTGAYAHEYFRRNDPEVMRLISRLRQPRSKVSAGHKLAKKRKHISKSDGSSGAGKGDSTSRAIKNEERMQYMMQDVQSAARAVLLQQQHRQHSNNSSSNNNNISFYDDGNAPSSHGDEYEEEDAEELDLEDHPPAPVGSLKDLQQWSIGSSFSSAISRLPHLFHSHPANTPDNQAAEALVDALEVGEDDTEMEDDIVVDVTRHLGEDSVQILAELLTDNFKGLTAQNVPLSFYQSGGGGGDGGGGGGGGAQHHHHHEEQKHPPSISSLPQQHEAQSQQQHHHQSNRLRRDCGGPSSQHRRYQPQQTGKPSTALHDEHHHHHHHHPDNNSSSSSSTSNMMQRPPADDMDSLPPTLSLHHTQSDLSWLGKLCRCVSSSGGSTSYARTGAEVGGGMQHQHQQHPPLSAGWGSQSSGSRGKVQRTASRSRDEFSNVTSSSMASSTSLTSAGSKATSSFLSQTSTTSSGNSSSSKASLSTQSALRRSSNDISSSNSEFGGEALGVGSNSSHHGRSNQRQPSIGESSTRNLPPGNNQVFVFMAGPQQNYPQQQQQQQHQQEQHGQPQQADYAHQDQQQPPTSSVSHNRNQRQQQHHHQQLSPPLAAAAVPSIKELDIGFVSYAPQHNNMYVFLEPTKGNSNGSEESATGSQHINNGTTMGSGEASTDSNDLQYMDEPPASPPRLAPVLSFSFSNFDAV